MVVWVIDDVFVIWEYFLWICKENNIGEYRKFGGIIFYCGWKVIVCVFFVNVLLRIEYVIDNKDDLLGCGCGIIIFVELLGGIRGNGVDYRECGLFELFDFGRFFLIWILLLLVLEIGYGE